MSPHHPEPFVPAGQSIAEVTVKSVLLGILLSLVLGAANVYFGLYAGMTVSASIPAAVISMAILRGILRRGTILENNIVQTIASAGESLAAGIIFTVPALVIVGAWQQFEFWPTVLIAICGGLLGVVFMVPLRRALIVEEEELVYPEGLACAEVLIAGEKGGESVTPIFTGLGLGVLFKFFSSGVVLLKASVEAATRAGNSVFFFGSDLSPALFAVGYIIKLEIASLVFLGGVIGWLIGIPLMNAEALSAESPLDAAWTLWSTQIRYMGVGAMLVGGLWSILNVRQGIAKSLRKLFSAFRTVVGVEVERTDQDMKGTHMILVGLGTAGLIFYLYNTLLQSVGMSLLTLVIMVVAAFFFVAVSSYICGLVGSSNNPVSGMTICTILGTTGLFLLFGYKGTFAIIATLGVAGVVCCAAATAGDVSQDLKTGLLVGATPRRMQWAQIIGVVIPAFIFPWVLTTLHNAYGIGTGLKAPQATLFASIAQAMFGDGHLPWNMVFIGMGIAVALVISDQWLKNRGSRFRTHVMPVAIGIYLPLTLSVPIFLGGMIRALLERRLGHHMDEAESTHDYGVLMSSGLIAGEAITGIGLAVLIGSGIGFPMNFFAHDGASTLLYLLLVLLFYHLTKRHQQRKVS